MSRQRLFRQVASLCASVRRLVLYSVLFAALGVFVAPVVAQNQPSTKDDEVLRVTTDLLLFSARVRDKKGQRPNGLTEQDLSLKDPDQVTSGVYLSRGVDRVAMVFVLDQSGSLRDLIKQQTEAALGLYERFGKKSSIAVLHFSETPRILVPFTRDSTVARDAFDVAAQRNQRTAIFDAAAKAVEMFDALPRAHTERRIVVLISDGLDTVSRTKPSAVIDAAQKKRVSFYVIHLGQYEVRDGRVAQRMPTKGFADLGSRTGGAYIYPGGWAFDSNQKVDLAPTFQLIEDDLRSQYLIGFYLNEKANDGRRHTFSLSLPEGLQYQISPRGYSRTQKFSVDRPREALKPRS